MQYKTLTIAALLSLMPIGKVYGYNQNVTSQKEELTTDSYYVFPHLSKSTKTAEDFLNEAKLIIQNGSYHPLHENKKGEKEEFIQLVNKSLNLKETARAYLYLGIVGHMAFNKLGYKEAVHNYEKALQLKPDYKRAYIALIATHSNHKNYKGCIHRSQQVLKLDLQNQAAKQLLEGCISRLDQRNFKKCLSDADIKELHINPRNKVVLDNASQCMSKLERKLCLQDGICINRSHLEWKKAAEPGDKEAP